MGSPDPHRLGISYGSRLWKCSQHDHCHRCLLRLPLTVFRLVRFSQRHAVERGENLVMGMLETILVVRKSGQRSVGSVKTKGWQNELGPIQLSLCNYPSTECWVVQPVPSARRSVRVSSARAKLFGTYKPQRPLST